MKSSEKKKTEKKKDGANKKSKVLLDDAADDPNMNSSSSMVKTQQDTSSFPNFMGASQRSYNLNDPWAAWKSQQLHFNHALPSSSYPQVPSTQPFEYFDQTSNTPLPSSSLDMHRSLGHTIAPISTAYESSCLETSKSISRLILPKRNELTQQLRSLEAYSQELSSSRRSIEQETIEDTESVISRLRSAEAQRQAAIKSSHTIATHELRQINDFLTLVSSYHNATPPNDNAMLEFLSRQEEFNAHIHHLTSTSSTSSCNSAIDLTLPKETNDRLSIISSLDHMHHLLSVKDHQLYYLSTKLRQLEEELEEKKRVCEEVMVEGREWMLIAERLKQQHSNVK